MTAANAALSSAPSWTATTTRASIEAGRVNVTAELAVPRPNHHTVKENNS